MVFARLFCAVGLLSVAFAAYGQLLTQRKPGLWELQYTLEGAQAEAEQQRMTERLKSMPPERRAQMEAAMAQRGTGMTLGPDGKPIVRMRFCLTAEEVLQESRGLLKGTAQDADCDRKVMSQSSREVHVHASCHGPNGPSEVDAKIYDVTPEAYAVDMKATGARGDLHMQQKVHWLGSDCKGATF